MKTKLILLILLSFSFLFSAEMIITKPLTEQIGDITLRQYPKMDFSGNTCALIKIKTELDPFDEIGSNRTPVDIVSKTGEVWVYLSAGDKRLYLSKSGYARLIYDIPLQLQSNTVYSMTIMVSGEKVEVTTLTFTLNIEGVVISREGKAPITATSTIVPFRLQRGKYNITFEKQGFQTQTKEIILQDDKTVEITMEEESSEVRFSAPGIVTIQSEPEGAEVELNGQKVGTTFGTYQGSHYAGEYTLTLRKDLYYPTTKSFTLQKGEVMDIPKIILKPRFGYWQISSEPSGADIYLDEKHIGQTPLKKEKIPSGDHTLRLSKNKYKTHQETFVIKDGDIPEFDVALKPNFALLEINSAPETNATVFIDKKEAGKTPYSDPMMQAGTYIIKIEKELWIGTTKTITIRPEIPEKINLILTKDFGTLIVEAEGYKIYLDGKEVGTSNFEQKLKPGSYKIKAAKEKHHDAEKDVFVNVGQVTRERMSLVPMLGSISVFAVDKRNSSKKITDADIFLDNKDSKKKTPAVLELLYGDYALKLKHPNFLDASKNINLKEGDAKTVTIEMDTYSGSILAKRNSWKTQGWISFSATALIAGGGYYYNMQMNDYLDKYNNTSVTTDAMEYKQKTLDFENYRDYCYYTASGAVIYSVFSWIKTAIYNGKL